MDLGAFDRGGLQRGASRIRETAWLLVRFAVFVLSPFRLYGLKRLLLRVFGADVGRGVVIKPGVKITFPWRLKLGDHCWIGEDVFILNLDRIEIGPNVCVSQRAFICTGNHDYKDPHFRVMTAPVVIQGGAWIGACAFVGPGVQVGENAVLCAASVATKDLARDTVYAGNPALKVRHRWVGERPEKDVHV